MKKVGAKAVESAMNTFKQITNEINLMSEQISLTLRLSNEIVGESKKVDNAIINVKDIATLTNNNAQAVAESIKDQATSFEIIAGESTELAGLAEELQSQINKFKL